jgi:hypothetical protein
MAHCSLKLKIDLIAESAAEVPFRSQNASAAGGFD